MIPESGDIRNIQLFFDGIIDGGTCENLLPPPGTELLASHDKSIDRWPHLFDGECILFIKDTSCIRFKCSFKLPDGM